jgi:hypothetical protein
MEKNACLFFTCDNLIAFVKFYQITFGIFWAPLYEAWKEVREKQLD